MKLVVYRAVGHVFCAICAFVEVLRGGELGRSLGGGQSGMFAHDCRLLSLWASAGRGIILCHSQTVNFGGCSPPHLMWGLQHRTRGWDGVGAGMGRRDEGVVWRWGGCLLGTVTTIDLHARHERKQSSLVYYSFLHAHVKGL